MIKVGCKAITETASSNELNWFDMETRMRKVLMDLLQPTLNRSHEDRDEFVQVKKQLTTIEKTVADLDYTVNKTNQTPTAFEEIFTKFFDIVSWIVLT